MRGKLSILALAAVAVTSSLFAFSAISPAEAKIHYKTHHPKGGLHAGLVYAPRQHERNRAGHFADLVGSPGSGYGFYPLPARYRIAAWRYKHAHELSPWQNPVYFAIATDAAGYHGGYVPGSFGNGHDMFNPIDGVGTPFFAGYYGPAGDDEDRPFLGRPYSH